MIPRLLAWCVALLLFLLAPHFLQDFHLFQICIIAATSLVTLGLVVVTGMAGQISLAQSAFVAFGAYSAAIVAMRWGVPLWAGIPLSATVAGLLGFLLGLATLRVSGHYLALATLAVTAMVQLALIHSDDLTGGAAGMPVPAFEIMGKALSRGNELYWVIVPTTATLFAVVDNLVRSRFGRTLAAVRQSETAASAMGIDVLTCKALAFAGSAFLGAFGGGLLAPLVTYLDPAQYGVTQTVSYLAVAVIGGLQSPIGALLGSAIFVLVPEFLQGLQSYLGLVFALLLCAFIVVRPEGLASLSSLLRVRGAAR